MADFFLDTVSFSLGEIADETLFEIRDHLSIKRVASVQADAVSSLALTKRLRKDALIGTFDIVVGAQLAEAALLGNVGQVREQSRSEPDWVEVVVNFGQALTVSGVGVIDSPSTPIKIGIVTPWAGTGFATKAAYSATLASKKDLPHTTLVTAAPPSTATHAIFNEIRTERLLLVILTTADAATIASSVWVHLPDAPADLELRVGGGPPVWTSPGPVIPGRAPWSSDARQTVSLGPALGKLLGDATDTSEADYAITLTARIPGRLSLTEAPGNSPLRFLHRVDLGPDGQRPIELAEEGVLDTPLVVPDWVASVDRVSLVASANLPLERVVPPIGPAPLTVLGGAIVDAGLAELVLDPDHAACTRLAGDLGLAQLVGVRLPLAAGPLGAELSIVLLDALGNGEPGAPMRNGATKPLTLDPGAPERWVTFRLARPVPIASPPWIAVQVARGQVIWRLGQFAVGQAAPVRRGPPIGPWRQLPSMLSSASTVGGRARAIGLAPPSAPLAPLLVELVRPPDGDTVDRRARVTPTPKGAAGEFPRPGTTLAHPVAPTTGSGPRQVALRITSYVAGTVTLRTVDLVASRS